MIVCTRFSRILRWYLVTYRFSVMNFVVALIFLVYINLNFRLY
jgi:uncharacterized membrane protein